VSELGALQKIRLLVKVLDGLGGGRLGALMDQHLCLGRQETKVSTG